MKASPNYFQYFTQAESPSSAWMWLEKEDYSWIDRINKERALEKQNRIATDIKEGRDPNNYTCSGEDIASKNFDDVEFPGSHEWPASFYAKYKATVAEINTKISEMVKTADKIIKIEEMEMFLDCANGNHYFSTPYYAHGAIQKAGIDDDSQFDSAETAVYAFINDYNEWNQKNGEQYRKMALISELEALREPVTINDSECQHEDLGSLGYKHGTTVKCPFCNQMAEVW